MPREHIDPKAMAALLRRWNHRTVKQMADAKHEQTEFGRRFVEYGAVCTYNCTAALVKLLAQSAQGREILADLGFDPVLEEVKRP